MYCSKIIEGKDIKKCSNQHHTNKQWNCHFEHVTNLKKFSKSLIEKKNKKYLADFLTSFLVPSTQLAEKEVLNHCLKSLAG